MNRAQHLIFPGLVLGCLAILLFSSLALNSQAVEAATGQANHQPVDSGQSQTKAASKKPSSRDTQAAETSANADCSLASQIPPAVSQWCSLIERAAGENHVEARLLAALIMQESGGNAEAYSSSGAVGLMQVMPRDGLAASFMCASGPCFASRPSMQELFDPEFNIRYGTRFLAGLINKYGDVREALRAYGPADIGYSYADLVLTIYQTYE